MQIILNGKLTKDPEIRFFENGKSVTDFSIAVNGFKNNEKTVNYYNCQIWDNEFVSEYCKKGQNINIYGYLKKEVYTNKRGEEKLSYKVIANKVNFSLAYGVINGVVKHIEKRYKNEKSYQMIKFDSLDYKIFNFSKDELEVDQVYTLCGHVELEDNEISFMVNKIFKK